MEASSCLVLTRVCSGRWVLQTCLRDFPTCKPMFSSHWRTIDKFSSARQSNNWRKRCCTSALWFLGLHELGERGWFTWHGSAGCCVSRLCANAMAAAQPGLAQEFGPHRSRQELPGDSNPEREAWRQEPIFACCLLVSSFQSEGRKGQLLRCCKQVNGVPLWTQLLGFQGVSLWLCCAAVVNRLWHLDGELAVLTACEEETSTQALAYLSLVTDQAQIMNLLDWINLLKEMAWNPSGRVLKSRSEGTTFSSPIAFTWFEFRMLSNDFLQEV